MKATELKSEGLKKEFKIVIPAKDFEQKVDDKLNEVSKNVKLPGFRPGKAPKAMLKQKYKASVMGEVVDEAVRSATEELIKDKKLRPAMMPDVKITAFGEGKDLEFEVSLEELPELIKSLLEDKEWAEKIAKKGKKRAQEELSWQVLTKDMVRYLEN